MTTRHCSICNLSISEERLEIVPTATECGPCLNRREYVKPIESMYFPEVIAESEMPHTHRNLRSFKLPRKKNVKKIDNQAKYNRKQRYTKLPGIKDSFKARGKPGRLVTVVFDNSRSYTYSIQKFSDTFKVNTGCITAALAGGFTFLINSGIMFMKRGDRIIKVGSVKSRQERFN